MLFILFLFFYFYKKNLEANGLMLNTPSVLSFLDYLAFVSDASQVISTIFSIGFLSNFTQS
jgi:hypothetical protein